MKKEEIEEIKKIWNKAKNLPILIDGEINLPNLEKTIIKFAEKLKQKWGEEIEKDFIREFCNDHSGKPRWLRNVALDLEDLLEQILEFFKQRIKKVGKNK